MDRQKDNKHVASHARTSIRIPIRLCLGRNSNLLQRMEEDAEREEEREARPGVCLAFGEAAALCLRSSDQIQLTTLN